MNKREALDEQAEQEMVTCDWENQCNKLKASQESLREHMKEIHNLRQQVAALKTVVDAWNNVEQEPVASVLPCPFCGDNKPTVFEGSTFRWRVAVCNNCGAYAPEVRHDTLAEDQKQAGIESDAAAITAWNTRAAPVRTKDLTRDEVEALFWKWKSSTEYPVPLFEFRDIASAVIAADRSKNK